MSDPTEYDIPAQACARCGYPMGRYVSVDGDRRPRPGDFAICMSCADLTVFEHDMVRRELSGLEAACARDEAVLPLIERLRRRILADPDNPARRRTSTGPGPGRD